MVTIAPGFRIPDPPSAAEMGSCVHCGLCLPHCPTFRELQIETASPRGRLHLMNALYEGRIEATDRFVEHMELCLDCRACEAACPSGVGFGHLMEATRAEIRERAPVGAGTRLFRAAVFGWLFDKPGRMAALAGALRLYQRSGVQSLVRSSGLLAKVAPKLAEAEELLPKASRRFFEPRGSVRPHGVVKSTVAFFAGCVMRVAFADTQRATVRVLARSGREVRMPEAQVCCGALHAHAGERERAKELARRNIEAFDASPDVPIVVNAAGCGAMLKEYGELLAHDAIWAERAKAFSARVRDLSEVLSPGDLGSVAPRVPLRVVYQDACHLLHAQRIRSQPRELLRAIPGVELVEIADADRCCGSAGIYNLTQPEMAERFGAQKAANVNAADPDVVVSANPGCMIQLEVHLRRVGSKARVMHLADFVDGSTCR